MSAARELWKMYQDEILHDKMLNLMLTDNLKAKMIEKSNEGTNKETRGTVKMGLYLMEEKFEDAVNNLQGMCVCFVNCMSRADLKIRNEKTGTRNSGKGGPEKVSVHVL